MDNYSFIANSEINYIEGLYQSYKADPKSVSEDWQKFFEGFDFSLKFAPGQNGSAVKGADVHTPTADPERINKEMEVVHLIRGYRSRGHLLANNNDIHCTFCLISFDESFFP